MKYIILIAALIFGLAHASETAKGMQKDYEAFKAEMQVKIDAAQKKIDELKASTKETGKEAREKTVADLEKTRDQLKTQLNDAKEQGASKWSAFKKSFAQSVDEMNAKIQKALKD